jgi:hypothetical protein
LPRSASRLMSEREPLGLRSQENSRFPLCHTAPASKLKMWVLPAKRVEAKEPTIFHPPFYCDFARSADFSPQRPARGTHSSHPAPLPASPARAPLLFLHTPAAPPFNALPALNALRAKARAPLCIRIGAWNQHASLIFYPLYYLSICSGRVDSIIPYSSNLPHSASTHNGNAHFQLLLLIDVPPLTFILT